MAQVGVVPADVLHALSSGKGPVSVLGAHFLRLPHPRTEIPSLFLSYERPPDVQVRQTSGNQTEILEVQAIAPPNARSWFIGNEVMADGKFLIMTPIDPVFLLIPILQLAYPDDGAPRHFRPADDIFEEASLKLRKVYATSGEHEASTVVSEKDILYFASLSLAKKALKHVCDTKEITSEIVVYRFSPSKVLEYLRLKVARLATADVFEGSRTLIRNLAKDGLMEEGKAELLQAGRIRNACDLVAQYVSNSLRNELIASYDFTRLDAHLKSMEDNTATVANGNPAKTKDASAGDKKRAISKSSHGVKKLKKVNVTGMTKLSDLFSGKGV